jgi:hypothetical protein
MAACSFGPPRRAAFIGISLDSPAGVGANGRHRERPQQNEEGKHRSGYIKGAEFRSAMGWNSRKTAPLRVSADCIFQKACV